MTSRCPYTHAYKQHTQDKPICPYCDESAGKYFAGTSNIQDCCNFSCNLSCQAADPERKREREKGEERGKGGEQSHLYLGKTVEEMAEGMHQVVNSEIALVCLCFLDHLEAPHEDFA